LPKNFRLPGKEVRVRRLGRGVLLEPMERSVEDIKAIFAEIDRLGGNDFLPEGRPDQPPMPPANDASTRMLSSQRSTGASPSCGGGWNLPLPRTRRSAFRPLSCSNCAME
jgi:antitoxin VapB